MHRNRSRRRDVAALLVLAAVTTGAVAIGPAFSAHKGGAGEAIRIKTSITFGPGDPTGEVRRGSFLGASAFCRGGRFRDRPGRESVIKTLRCPNGRLKISFLPGGSPGGPQSGSWRVVGGSGRFEGLRGHGWMIFKPGKRPDRGRETFIGTVAD